MKQYPPNISGLTLTLKSANLIETRLDKRLIHTIDVAMRPCRIRRLLWMIVLMLTTAPLLFSQVATVTSISPTSGPAGTTVTINGSNFGSTTTDNRVFFGTFEATVTSASTTQLQVTVPFGASYAPVIVLNGGFVGYSAELFNTTFSDPTYALGVPTDYTTGAAPQDIEGVDLDGDGVVEIVSTNSNENTLSILTQSGGNFTASLSLATGAKPYGLAVGDLNGDGKPDIAVANQNASSVSLFQNTSTSGSISFTSLPTVAVGASCRGTTMADLDNDGKTDLLVVNQNSGSVSVLMNNTVTTGGTISFESKHDVTGIGTQPQEVAVGDFDKNGNVDFAVAIKNNDLIRVVTLDIDKSSGSTVITSSLQGFATGDQPQSITAGDFDGDGWIDLATSDRNDDVVSVFLNLQSTVAPGFGARAEFTTADSPFDVAAGDVNGDGLVDIITANSSSGGNGISVLTNQSSVGSLSFAGTNNLAGNTGSNPKGVAVGDINADGILDILTANSSGDDISVWKNSSTASDFLSFSMAEQVAAASIDATNHTISISVGSSQSLTSLIPTFSLSAGASAAIGATAQESGITANDYSSDVVYTITAESGSTQDWTISVTNAQASTEADFVSFSIPGELSSAVINTTDHTITGTVYNSGDKNFTPSFSLSDNASAKVGSTTQTSGTSTVDFSSTVTYEVTAEDGTTTQDWNVTLSFLNPVISSFSPLTASEGATVTINGQYFGETIAENTVYFGTDQATVTSASADQLEVTVPSSVNYSKISVEIQGVTGSSTESFTPVTGGANDFDITINVHPTENSAAADYLTSGEVTNEPVNELDVLASGKGYADLERDLEISDFQLTNATLENGRRGDHGWIFTIKPIADGEVVVAIPGGVLEDVSDGGRNNPQTFSYQFIDGALLLELSSSESGTVNGTFQVTFTFNAAVTGFEASDVNITNGTIDNFTPVSATVYTADIIPTISGNHTSVSVAADAASKSSDGRGNIVSNTLSYLYEDPLEVTITADALVNGTFTATITFDESVTGFDASDLLVSNGSKNNFTGSGAEYTIDITPGTDGEVTLDIAAGAAQDAGGNDNIQAVQQVVLADLTAPVISLTASDIVNHSTTYTISISEEVTGFESDDLSVENGSLLSFSDLGDTYTVDVSGDGSGLMTLTVMAGAVVDLAGNTNEEVSVENDLEYEFAPVFNTTPTTSIDNSSSSYYSYAIEVTDENGDDIAISAPVLPGWLSLDKIYIVSTAYTINGIGGIAIDSQGNIFVSNGPDDTIIKIDTEGNQTVFAGSDEGFTDGTGTDASFDLPAKMTIDSEDNLYVVDQLGGAIRKITPSGEVSTLAGSDVSGHADGTGADARFSSIRGIAVDNNSGNVYVTSYFGDSKTVRKITSAGVVTTLTSTANGDDIAVDSQGNIFYINDSYELIKRDTDGNETVLAGGGDRGDQPLRYIDGIGTNARFGEVNAMTFDSDDNLYLADGAMLRSVSPEGVVTTLAGDANDEGFTDGIGTNARFGSRFDIAVASSGAIYVGDRGNDGIRKLTGEPALLGRPEVSAGDYNVRLEATDGINESTTQEFTISVTDVVAEVASLDIFSIDLPEYVFISEGDGYAAFEGYPVQYALTYNKAVYVTGEPYIEMNLAGERLTYKSGSGSDRLIFEWTATADLNNNLPITYAGTDALKLNGGSIKDISGTDMPLTLDDSFDSFYRVGNSTVKSITTTAANGTYGIGDEIELIVEFESDSELISVDGSNDDAWIKLNIQNGDEDVIEYPNDYEPGPGPNQVTFTVIVEEGDHSADLDFVRYEEGDGFGDSDSPEGNGAASLFNEIDRDEYWVTFSGKIEFTDPDLDHSIAAVKDIVIDGIRPTVDMSFDKTIGTSFVATLTFSEEVSGFDVSDLVVSNATASNPLGSGSVYTVDIVPDALGVVTLDLEADRVTDIAENGNVKASQITALAVSDSDNFNTTVTPTDDLGIAGHINATGGTATIAFDNGVTDFEQSDIVTSNLNIVSFTAISAFEYQVGFEAVAEGAASLNVPEHVASDGAAGNGEATPLILVADPTVPGVTITADALVNGIFTATITFDESVTGFDASDLLVSNGSKNNFTGSGAEYTIDITPGTDGEVTLDIAAGAAQDAGVNDNIQAVQQVVLADLTAPVISLTASDIVNHSTTYTISISEEVTGFESDDLSVENGSLLSFSDLGDTYTVDVSGDGSGLMTLTVMAGAVVDLAGNTNEEVSVENDLEYELAPVFNTTPTTSIDNSSSSYYTYIIDATDPNGDEVAISAPVLPGWLSLDKIYTVSTAYTINGIRGIAIDSQGNIFVSNAPDDTIIKIDTEGNQTVFAGSDEGFTDGTGTDASFDLPAKMTIDSEDNLYVVDQFGDAIRKITPSGEVSTLAGSDVSGHADGTGTDAGFSSIEGIAVDNNSGNVYVTSYFGDSKTLRKITSAGVVTTLTSTANEYDIAVDSQGNIFYINDSYELIKRDTDGNETVLAGGGDRGDQPLRYIDGIGTNARFGEVTMMTFDSDDNLYLADGAMLRSVSPEGVVTTLAGDANDEGFTDGIGTNARFGSRFDIAVASSGAIYVGDQDNNRIRKLTGEPALLGRPEVSAGDYNVRLEATDGINESTTQEFTISVTDVVAEVASLGLFSIDLPEYAIGDGEGNVAFEGYPVQYALTYNKAVYVTGEPYIEMNLAGERLTYKSGSGSDRLIFEWTATADLNNNLPITYAGTDALKLNGGGIKDISGTDMPLTLDDSFDSFYRVGTWTVKSITTTAANGTYGIGDEINLIVEFESDSELLSIDDSDDQVSIKLNIQNGNEDVNEYFNDYEPGPGPNQVTFTVIVEEGDHSADLDFVRYEEGDGFGDADSPEGNGAAGLLNDLDGDEYFISYQGKFEFTDPDLDHSIAAVKDIVIDGVRPTVDMSFDKTIGTSFVATLTFSEEVSGFDVSDLVVSNATASILSVSGSVYTVDIVPDALGVVTLDLEADRVTDIAENGNVEASQITALAVSDSDNFNTTLIATYDLGIAGYINATGGTATIAFDNGVTGFEQSDIVTSNLNIVSFTAISAFEYHVGFEAVAEGAASLNVPEHVASDGAAGNGEATPLTLIADLTIPGVTISADPLVNGTFTATITFDESVTGFAVSDLMVGNGSKNNFTGSGAEYTVDITPTSDGNVTIDIAAGAAVDAAGNGNGTASQFSITAAIPPVLIDFDFYDCSGCHNTYWDGDRNENINVALPGDVLRATVTYDEVVYVTGTPYIELNFGDNKMEYVSGSGTKTLTFAWTAGTDDNNDEPVTYSGTDALKLNGGTIRDVHGADAIIELTDGFEIFNVADIRFSIKSVTTTAESGTYGIGDQIDVIFEMEEATAPVELLYAPFKIKNVGRNNDVNWYEFELDEAVTATSFTFTITVEEGDYSEGDFDLDLSEYPLELEGDYVASNGLWGTYFSFDVPFADPDNAVGLSPTKSIRFDGIRPTVEITTDTDIATAFVATLTFSEDVTEPGLADIIVGNGMASNLVGSGSVYTVDITPDAAGEVTIGLGADAVEDIGGNGNTPAAQIAVTALEVLNVTIEPAYDAPVDGLIGTAGASALITFSTDVTGFEQSDIMVNNLNITSFTANSASEYEIEFTAIAEGAATLDIPANVAVNSENTDNEAATRVSMTADLTPPVATLSTAESSPSNAGTFEVSIAFEEDITGLDAGDFSVTNGSLTNVTGSGGNYSAELSPAGDGEVKISLAASLVEDGAGNANGTSNELTVTSDRTVPSVTISAASLVNGAFTATITFSESVTGFELSDIEIGNGSANANSFAGSGANYTVGITPIADGNVTLDIAASKTQDIAGNDNTAASQAVVLADLTNPSVTINSSANDPINDSFEVTITFDEAVTGFDISDINVTNGAASNFAGSGTSYSADITPSSDGAVTVNIAANAGADAAGNGNQAATQLSLTYDGTAPGVTITSNASDLVYGTSYTAIITFSETVTGFDVSDINLGNATASGFSGNGEVFTVLISRIVDGEVTISIDAGAAVDQVGLSNTASNTVTKTIEAINEAPTAILLGNTSVSENEAPGTQVGLLSATDPDNDDTHTFVLVSGDGDEGNGAFNIIGTALVTTQRFDYETQSSYSVRMRATDARGLTFDVVKTISINNEDEPGISINIPDPDDETKSVSDMSFTNTRVGQTSTRTFSVTNSGSDGSLTVSAITLPTGFVADVSSFSLSSGSSQDVTVTFTPTTEQTYLGSVLVTSNVGENNFAVAGYGEVNNAPVAIAPAATLYYVLGSTIQLIGYDPDGDEISYEIVTSPTNGTLTASTVAGQYTFAPNATLSPETLYEDKLTFRVVETNGTLNSSSVDLNFNFRITDQAHDINGLSLGASDASNLTFQLDFTDAVINDAYTLEVSYYDQSDPTDPVLTELINQDYARSDLTISGTTASLSFDAASTDHGFLFSTGKKFISATLRTSNGYSDTEAYILDNSPSGSDIQETLSGSDDGDFFVFASKTTVPENETAEINLYAVELSGLSLEGASISIVADAEKGETTTPVQVKNTGLVAQWTLEYTSDSDVALTDAFEFSVSHPEREESASTLANIEVIEVADAPVLSNIPDQQTKEEETLTIDLEIVDPDSEVEVIATSSEATNVPITVVGHQLLITPAQDFTGIANITVVVREKDTEAPLSDFDQFELTVTPVNDKPVVGTINDITIDEDGNVVVPLTATDVDAELPIFSYAVNADQSTVTYSLDGNNLTIVPDENYSGTINFSVVANDGLGTTSSISDPEAFALIVTPVNDAPQVSASINPQSLIEGFPSYSLDLSQYFSDVETAADELTYTISTVNNVTTSISGAEITISPVSGFAGVEVATVTASDGSLSVSQNMTFITTAASGEISVASPIADLTLDEDFDKVSIDLSGVFSYSTDPDAVFSYVISGNNNVIASMNGQVLELTAPEDFNGDDGLFIIGTADGKAAFTSFDILVNAVNDAPVLNGDLGDETIAEDAVYSRVIGDNLFEDIDGDQLTVTASYEADWLSFDANTLTLSGTPENEDIGDYTITIKAADPSGLSVSETFALSVTNTNDDPTAIDLETTVLDENAAVGTVVTGMSSTDPDVGDDTFSYALVSGTGDEDNGKFEVVDGKLVTAQVLDYEEQSSYSVRIRTTDGFQGSYAQSFNITLNDVNDAVTGLKLIGQSITENSDAGTTVGTLSSTDPDATDSFSYALVEGEGDTDNALFDIVEGNLVAQSAFDFETQNSYSVRIQTTDKGGTTYQEAFTVAVNNANEVATDISLDNNSILENEDIGAVVGNLSTSDEDVDDVHNYELVEGDGATDNGLFAITDGQLTARASFDYESQSAYSIRVRTTDRGGLSFEKVFTINITNQAEAILRVEGVLSFEATGLGDQSVLSYTIHNDGDAVMEVTSITYPAGFSGDWSGGQIAIGASREITVTFKPDAQQTYSGIISVITNAGTGTIQVTGEGAIVTSIEPVDPPLVVNIYPNPTARYLYIDLSSVQSQAEVTITDLNGRKVFSTTSEGQDEMRVDVTRYKQGVYLLRVESKGRLSTTKVMIKR